VYIIKWGYSVFRTAIVMAAVKSTVESIKLASPVMDTACCIGKESENFGSQLIGSLNSALFRNV
jgi:hypothetical protein